MKILGGLVGKNLVREEMCSDVVEGLDLSRTEK